MQPEPSNSIDERERKRKKEENKKDQLNLSRLCWEREKGAAQSKERGVGCCAHEESYLQLSRSSLSLSFSIWRALVMLFRLSACPGSLLFLFILSRRDVRWGIGKRVEEKQNTTLTCHTNYHLSLFLFPRLV